MEFDAVIVAAPAYRAADLLEGANASLALLLREIDYASSVVVVTAHRLSDVAHPLDAYGLVVPRREQRMVLAVSFLSRKFPGRAPADRVVLRTFIGGALQPELCSLPDEDLRAIASAALEDMLGARGEPELTRVVRYDRAMPQYHVGHLERVRRIEAEQARTPGLHLCGSAYRGVGIPDCIHDGELAAENAWSNAARQS
jgi:oxygen-dependent protoporphyrinogen oxidase